MTVFFNNIKRIFRKRANFIFMIVIPVAMISFITSMSNQTFGIRCGIVDYDDTVFTIEFIESLEEKVNVSFIEESEIQNKIFGQYLDMVIVIDEGLTQNIIDGNKDIIRVAKLTDSDMSIPISFYIESYVNAAYNVSQAAAGDEVKFNKGMEEYRKEIFSVSSDTIDRTGSEVPFKKQQLGFLAMSMLFLASISSMIMIEDKEKKVYYRMIAGPLKNSQYMLQSLLSFFTIMVIQVFAIFFFLTNMMGISYGEALLPMIITTIVFALSCVALGLAINSVSKDMRQSGVFMSLLISPMCMLGGLWWPAEFMPEVLRKIAQFVPTTWIMNAYENILVGGKLSSATNEIIVLLGFTAVFFLFAAWKKTDVAK